tara:strand:- start:444 stop:668 length:225 start_codon:yes stop_codon:yes gene_type:complete
MKLSKKLIDNADKITINIGGTEYNIKDRQYGDVIDLNKLEDKYGEPTDKTSAVDELKNIQNILVNDMKKNDDIF